MRGCVKSPRAYRFRIAEERPQTGEFSTTWQRFDELSASMAQRLGGVAGSSSMKSVPGFASKPGVQRNTSEVYVVTVERAAGSATERGLPARAENTGVDAALVDEMLVAA